MINNLNNFLNNSEKEDILKNIKNYKAKLILMRDIDEPEHLISRQFSIRLKLTPQSLILINKKKKKKTRNQICRFNTNRRKSSL